MSKAVDFAAVVAQTAERLRALVNRAASVLFVDEMARIRRRHRVRQVRARQPGGAPCPTN